MRWHDGDTWVWKTMMMLAFWGILALGVVALVRRTRPMQDPLGDEAAQLLLDRRYAGGDIDENDYTRRSALWR